jgi:hypothetical protein
MKTRATIDGLPLADQGVDTDDLGPLEKMTFAVTTAIIDASPKGDDGLFSVNLDTAVSTLAYLIAAIAVQAKSVETEAATKAFVHQIACGIEHNVKAILINGDPAPFAPAKDILRLTDRR